MRRHYPAVLAGLDEDQIDVAFPDFPGCVTVANSIEQAHARAAEVLAFHVESMVEDGDAIPTGGDEAALLEFVKDYEADGHRVMVASICVEIPSGKMRHVELDLPEHVAERIDRWVEDHGKSREDLLASAAMDYMAKRA
jgi:predicted RNase H-like HicB family nuclease